MRLRLLFATLVGLQLSGGAPPAAAVVLDSFDTSLPENPRLPESRKQILFAGPQCDGEFCPPDEIVDSGEQGDQIQQAHVPGVLCDNRFIYLYNAPEGDIFPMAAQAGFRGPAELAIDRAGDGLLRLIAMAGSRGTVFMRYEGPFGGSPTLDLLAVGADRLEVDVTEFTASQPPMLLVLIVFTGVPPVNGIGVHFAEVSGPGTLTFPLAEFYANPDWHAVRTIEVQFGVQDPSALTLALGEIRATATPTPAMPASWGRIKSAYRR